MAIHKLNKQLMNLRLRDIDADAPIRADRQRRDGFQTHRGRSEGGEVEGFLSLEQDPSSVDMKETCRRYLSTMKEYLA